MLRFILKVVLLSRLRSELTIEEPVAVAERGLVDQRMWKNFVMLRVIARRAAVGRRRVFSREMQQNCKFSRNGNDRSLLCILPAALHQTLAVAPQATVGSKWT
jgi:hypothetical protein